MDGTRLVWDMDGTLLDSADAVVASLAGTVAELSGSEPTHDEVTAAYPLGPPERILAFLLGRELRGSESDVYYRRLSRAAPAPYPGVVSTLDALRERGHPVVVFTGSNARGASMLLRESGLAVDVLVCADDVAHPKPAPDGLFLVAERLLRPPSDVAYIGDSPSDTRAAGAAGARAVAAGWGYAYEPTEPADITLHQPGDALALLPPLGATSATN